MFKVIRDIFRRTVRETLPKLENTFTSDYDPESIGDDELLIMLAGVAKDPMEARRLMTDYEASKMTGVRFIGRAAGPVSPFPPGTTIVKDLTDLYERCRGLKF